VAAPVEPVRPAEPVPADVYRGLGADARREFAGTVGAWVRDDTGGRQLYVLLQYARHGELGAVLPRRFEVEHMAALLDEHRAAEPGRNNQHTFETRLREWLASQEGERFHAAWTARGGADVEVMADTGYDPRPPEAAHYASLGAPERQRFYQDGDLWRIEPIRRARSLVNTPYTARDLVLDLGLALHNQRHRPAFAGLQILDAVRILDELAARDAGRPNGHYYEQQLIRWTGRREGAEFVRQWTALVAEAAGPAARIGGWLPDGVTPLGLAHAGEELRDRTVIRVDRVRVGKTETYRAHFAGGGHGVYKPGLFGGQRALKYSVPPDQVANREIAAYLLSELLGFHLVPPTVWWEGHRGPGSMALWIADTEAGRLTVEYSRLERERMAVLDYILGNMDRHIGNYLTMDGRPVAIDHGFTFPESDRQTMRSSFLEEFFNGDHPQLSGEVLARVNAVRPEDLAGILHAMGLTDAAVSGAVERLREVQTDGRITGHAWRGPITLGISGLIREAQR
jgi:hypothetical protein